MNIDPLPVEKELRIEVVKRYLEALSREELIEYLSESIDTVVRLTHHGKQLLGIIDTMENKINQLESKNEEI